MFISFLAALKIFQPFFSRPAQSNNAACNILILQFTQIKRWVMKNIIEWMNNNKNCPDHCIESHQNGHIKEITVIQNYLVDFKTNFPVELGPSKD